MSQFLLVGETILRIIEEDWERIDELGALLALRAELIGALDPAEGEQILLQDQRLQNACASQLNRLRTRRRFNAYTRPVQARYVDQHG
jgi:hypothetical protein